MTLFFCNYSKPAERGTMRAKILVISGLCLTFLSCFAASARAIEYKITQLTNNSYNDSCPRISNGQVVWMKEPYGPVFLYNGYDIIQLNGNNPSYGRPPVIDNGQVAWTEEADNASQVFLYDGKDVRQITHNTYNSSGVNLSGGQLAWVSNDNRVFFYDGTKTLQLSNHSYLYDAESYLPKINKGQIVWEGHDEADNQIIYLYNSNEVVQVSQLANTSVREPPLINNGKVIWDGWARICLFDGKETKAISGDVTYSFGGPCIDNGMMAWAEHDGKTSQIYLYNGTDTIKLANDGFVNRGPTISGNQVAWTGENGVNTDIFLYNGKEVKRLTTDGKSGYPAISGGQVVWQTFDGTDSEIFLATPVGSLFTTGSIIRGAPAVGDLNNDGSLEIIFGSCDHYIYCINKKGGLLWKYDANTNYIAAMPVITNIDGAGDKEVLVGAGQTLYCFTKDGKVIWQYAFSAPLKSPTVADLDGTGAQKVLVSMSDGYLYCLDKAGQVAWKFKTGSRIARSPAVADINADGKLEIIITSYDDTYKNPNNNNVYCLDRSGKLLWLCNITSEIATDPVVADLDADGRADIIVCSDCNLYRITYDGKLLWKKEIGCIGLASVADLNGDGQLEILLGRSDHDLMCCYDSQGQLLWEYKVDAPVYDSPVCADINNDGALEVLFGAQYHNFYCLNNNGQLIWKYSLPQGIDCYSAVADLDGDNNLEVIFGLTDHNLYCLNKDGENFSVPAVQGKIDPMPWPMFQHDPQHTGLYDRTPPAKPIVKDEGDYTNKTNQLYGSWLSEDKESGVCEYRYRITEDSTTGKAVRDWTIAPGYKYATAGALSLASGKTYFFAVKAKNNLGMWSDIGYSDGIKLNTVAPVTTISGVDGLWHTANVVVTLSASEPAGIDKTYYSLDWTPPSVQYNGPFTVSVEGTYTPKFYSIDKAGNKEAVKSAASKIMIDKTAPTGAITINKNAASTASALITLDLSATDAISGMGKGAQMRFSNDNITWSAPESYAQIKKWDLPGGNGTKTVYVKFKDAAGNWSAVYSDSITLQIPPPQISKVQNLFNTFFSIQGNNFGPRGPFSKVAYYSQSKLVGSGWILTWRDNEIVCILSNLRKGAYDMKVTNQKGESNSYSFKVGR